MTTASDRRTIRVGLGARSYDAIVGPALLAEAGRTIRDLTAQRRLVVVTDETVAARHAPALTASLKAADFTVTTLTLPAGEATKSFAQLETLLDRLLAAGVERQDLIVALGGGVIGDLVGFAAAILRRGVDFVQVPTTLLAQVDSSVGGKTGLNTRHGKNLIGAFHQPKLVLADTDVLSTLPRRELLAGYAEVVKYGLIDDAAFFAWLEAHGPALLDGDAALRVEAVATCVAAKARVVAADEREGGVRALLNLGHTFGHALETATGHGPDLLHGEAVAIGMVMAFELSARLGLCAAEEAARVRAHLAAVGLPTDTTGLPGSPFDPARLYDLMRQDKKVLDGRIRFVLAKGIGGAFLTDAPSEADVLTALAA